MSFSFHRVVAAAIFVCGAALAAAAPLTRDLGEGLLYHRVHELPADLPARSAAKGALVLDVRYVRGEAEAGVALAAWLRFRASARTPVFVLANAATAPAVRRALAELGPADGVMVIGAAADDFAPDIAVSISAGEERRAYDALATGVALAAVLVENPDKVRNDEASLSRDRLAEASADATGEAEKTPPPPPIDAALQRAVHVHRALRALRKI
jgi:hypothetical protein